MSTISTRAYGQDWHIYDELFDLEHVYIEINDVASVSVSANNGVAHVTIGMTHEIWLEICNAVQKFSKTET